MKKTIAFIAILIITCIVIASPITDTVPIESQDYGAFRPYKNWTRTALTGTVEFTNGAKTIAGTLTAFLTELQAGDVIYDSTDKYSVIVTSITNDTTATAISNYEGTGGAAHACVRYRVTGAASANAYGLPSMRTFTLPALGSTPQQINIEGITADYATVVCDRAMRLVIVEQGTNEAECAQALLTNQYTCFCTIMAGSWNTEMKQMLTELGTDYAIYVCSNDANTGTVSVAYHAR